MLRRGLYIADLARYVNRKARATPKQSYIYAELFRCAAAAGVTLTRFEPVPKDVATAILRQWHIRRQSGVPITLIRRNRQKARNPPP